MSANKMFHRFAPLALSAAVVFAIPACKKQEAAPAAGPQAASTTAASTATAAPVVSAAVAQMTPEQLRDAARKAYDDNRLYAPTGNNAMEYYLALRDKQPGDASASSALSDLLPMAVIATEQGIAREDFEEAKRLVALIGKADPNHPALARLKASVDKGVALAAQRAQQQQLTAEQEAKLKEDQKKLQEQQRQLAAQQAQQAQQAAAADQQRQAAEAEAQRRAAAQAAAAPTPAAPAPAAPRPTASNSLQVVSQASPRFPPAAQRAGAKGSVQVEFTVGSDGSVTGARVVSSDVPRQFARDFEREALSAVKRWRFQPINQATTTRRTISFD